MSWKRAEIEESPRKSLMVEHLATSAFSGYPVSEVSPFIGGSVRVKASALIFLNAALLLTACAGSDHLISSGDRYVAGADISETYALGAGDKVRMTVFSEPTLSGEFSVSTDGELSLPLIGNVAVANMTLSQVTGQVQSLLADGYLRNPRVSMEIISYRPFFVLGEVKAPGQYAYASGMTALNAVATAEGYTPRASKKIIYIRRFGEKVEQAYELTPNLRVMPGDTLRIGERYF